MPLSILQCTGQALPRKGQWSSLVSEGENAKPVYSQKNGPAAFHRRRGLNFVSWLGFTWRIITCLPSILHFNFQWASFLRSCLRGSARPYS